MLGDFAVAGEGFVVVEAQFGDFGEVKGAFGKALFAELQVFIVSLLQQGFGLFEVACIQFLAGLLGEFVGFGVAPQTLLQVFVFAFECFQFSSTVSNGHTFVDQAL